MQNIRRTGHILPDERTPDVANLYDELKRFLRPRWAPVPIVGKPFTFSEHLYVGALHKY